MYEEEGGVQQLKWIEDKRCIEWEWCRKHKRQKNRKVQWMRAGRQSREILQNSDEIGKLLLNTISL
jgi:hypothetical protein